MTARDGKRRDAGFTRRLVLATTLQGAALAALGFRLYSLQVPRQDDFLADSLNTRTVTRFDAPTRGTIVDRFGQPLAGNEQSYNLMYYPKAEDEDVNLNRTAVVLRAASLIGASPALTDRMVNQLDVGVDVVRGQFRLLLVLNRAQYDTLLTIGIEAWPGFGVQEKLGNYGLNYKVVSGVAQEEAAALERIIALLDLDLADQRQISRRIVEAKQIN
ncbi:MAG: hypothetical protein ISQ28_03985, partial [Alphaproteobacteria bacterium]|nr:hypothetical protein [Alphaproteobacteria bacterium]